MTTNRMLLGKNEVFSVFSQVAPRLWVAGTGGCALDGAALLNDWSWLNTIKTVDASTPPEYDCESSSELGGAVPATSQDPLNEEQNTELPEATVRNGMIWGMNVESYKALAAAERMRVRNKLSARNFRARKNSGFQSPHWNSN